MERSSTVSIAVSEELASQLPPDPKERQEVVALGLREWRVRKALDAYRRGEGSLAYAARQAGVSLREMIPLAYAHGLVPRVSSAAEASPIYVGSPRLAHPDQAEHFAKAVIEEDERDTAG